MGLPVISTVFNGACEIMNDGRHGFVLADPADAPMLTAAMRQLLDPTARAKMSQACLELRPSLSLDWATWIGWKKFIVRDSNQPVTSKVVPGGKLLNAVPGLIDPPCASRTADRKSL